MKVSSLFVDDFGSVSIQTLDVKIFQESLLFFLICCRVKRPDIRQKITLGDVENLISHPDWIGMPLVIRLRSHLERIVFHVYNPNWFCLTASVISPLRIPEGDLLVSDVLPVRRDFSVDCSWNSHWLRNSADFADFKEFGFLRCKTLTTGSEGDMVSVGSPACDQICTRMPGESLGITTFGWDQVNIGVTVVFGGKGDLLSVRRKMRKRFFTFIAGETDGRTSGFRHFPKVIGINEDDFGLAESGLAEQLGALPKSRKAQP